MLRAFGHFANDTKDLHVITISEILEATTLKNILGVFFLFKPITVPTSKDILLIENYTSNLEKLHTKLNQKEATECILERSPIYECSVM